MKFCITIVKHIENIAHHYITPLVINSLGGGHTHTHTNTHTHTHTDDLHRINFKKPGAATGVCLV